MNEHRRDTVLFSCSEGGNRMKNIIKKGMSGLLAVVMCLSTFIGIGATHTSITNDAFLSTSLTSSFITD